MQAQNENFRRLGLVQSFAEISRKEGVAGLWRVSIVYYYIIASNFF